MKRISLTAGLLVCLGSVPAGVEATLLDLASRDWINAGDGLVTYDSTTGLEWLDLTVTLNNSIVDTEQESFFGAGTGQFHWATSAQVASLMNHISGVDLSLTVADSMNVVGAPQAQFEQVLAWVNLLGITEDINTPAYPLNRKAHGISRFAEMYPSEFGLGFISTFSNGTTHYFSAWNPIANCCWTGVNTRPIGVGSWLVRQAAVPEPSALALMTLGMAGVGYSSRRARNLK